MWFVSNGIIECHIENLQIEIGNRTPNCLRHHVWLDVSTFNKCLFTTKQRGFLLILICETSQIFVWRNKAFIFFQKSDIIQPFLPWRNTQLHKPKPRPQVLFLVFCCLIPVSVVVRCQQPVAQICVVDTCTCKASVA